MCVWDTSLPTGDSPTKGLATLTTTIPVASTLPAILMRDTTTSAHSTHASLPTYVLTVGIATRSLPAGIATQSLPAGVTKCLAP